MVVLFWKIDSGIVLHETLSNDSLGCWNLPWTRAACATRGIGCLHFPGPNALVVGKWMECVWEEGLGPEWIWAVGGELAMMMKLRKRRTRTRLPSLNKFRSWKSRRLWTL